MEKPIGIFHIDVDISHNKYIKHPTSNLEFAKFLDK